MDYFIRIKPKQNISTFSKSTFEKMNKDGILSYEFLTHNEEGKVYNYGGYVRCYYGENDLRYVVYKNLPNFGNVVGRFKTLSEAEDCLIKEGVV